MKIILVISCIISLSLLFSAQTVSASVTERALRLIIEGKVFIIPVSAYGFERTTSVEVDEIFLNQIVGKFSTGSFVFYNQVSEHTVDGASIKIEPKVARLLEVKFVAAQTQVAKAPSAKAFPEKPISVALKFNKETTLLAIKNIGDKAVYGIIIKANGGDLKFGKARGWYLERIDPSTVILHAKDTPLTKGGNMTVLLIGDGKYSGLQWIMLDSAYNIIWSGALASR